MGILFFEHPLDELARLSLRIEFIVNNFNYHINQDHPWAERACIQSIVNLAHILDRPDLKSKYARDISVHIQQLNALANNPNLNLVELKHIITLLKEYGNYFAKPGKLGLNLRENFFLNTIRQHLLYPGGDADFELPAYYCWLHISREEKVATLNAWFKEFAMIIESVELLLKLTRNKAQSKNLVAISGFHHEPLDSRITPKILQIKLQQVDQIYPSISAGKHRINIRFNKCKHLISEEQVMRDIDFELTLCF